MDSYTFVRTNDTYFDNFPWIIKKMHIPEDAQEDSDSWIVFDIGRSIQVSNSCNPNFTYFRSSAEDCDAIKEFVNGCDATVEGLIYNGVWNENGHLETFLQCPQCGCGSEGAVNLNDLYAAEVESLSLND